VNTGAPLVSVNINSTNGQALTPSQAYQLMLTGQIEVDPNHPAFRPVIEAPQPSDAVSGHLIASELPQETALPEQSPAELPQE
jgi:hypothetical protein